MKSNRTDTLYSAPLERIADFAFDDQVAQVFPDMIERSVPGYRSIIGMTGVIARRHADNGGRCYDLGCSLGASTLSMVHQLSDTASQLVAVDNSAAMLERAKAQPGMPVNIEWRCEDICDTPFEDAAVVVMNFTLQFVPLAKRDGLLQRIRQGMRDDGVLLLSEKIRFEDPALDRLNRELHEGFKQGNGYTELEISQKRTALENVLLPETLAAHRQRLQSAGFTRVEPWFQCFNFLSLVAFP